MSEWLQIKDAPRDLTPVLAVLRLDISKICARPDLDAWNGLQVVLCHPGVHEDGFDPGWHVSGPVGQGGIPDRWIEGWQPLGPRPAASLNVSGEDAQTDRDAVEAFTALMHSKMAASRAKGRNGWNNPDLCPAYVLQDLFAGHLSKTNPGNAIDLSCLLMMMLHRGIPIKDIDQEPPPPRI